MTSLNPAFTVGDQIAEVILRHRPVSRDEANAMAITMLRRVRIAAPEQRFTTIRIGFPGACGSA